ncbi:SOS response-associated peptidase family protein [Pseudomonas mandelii]|uniref:SOS response-associated peptidase family protein n=1 Tax=Pseudomonas mandelii TaxID=75612 RepID=UPI00209DF7F2|nr:SOS response-associated peptidase family protein [Pseudomonas mandelii]
MCGRLSQSCGIQDFVAALNIPNALINYAGDQPFELYNAAPSSQLALLHQEGQFLRADMVRWGWRPHWAKDRAASRAQVERVNHNPYFRAIWPHRAIVAIDNWFEWVAEGGPKKQPYLIRRKDRAPILCTAIGQYPSAEHESGEHDGFVFLSSDSNGGMVDSHDWRPVTLNPELAREWLNPATSKERAEQIMLLQWEPTEAFEWFKIDRPVGSKAT